jgi:hypothetical protein
MTREEEKQEKARELAIKYCKDIDYHGKEVYNIGCAIACCEMADWADQHPRKGLVDIERVCEVIRTDAKYFVIMSKTDTMAIFNSYDFINRLKQMLIKED